MGSRAREALGELNAHAVDTIQGLGEIIAFQRIPERRAELIERTENHHTVRLPFFRDLTLQTTFLEVATGLGGLAVVVAGATLVDAGRLESGYLPLLTLLSMAAFLPISEISNVSRQLADTLGSTRRLYAVDNEPVPVTDGDGVALDTTGGGLPIELKAVDFQYEGGNRRPYTTRVSPFPQARRSPSSARRVRARRRLPTFSCGFGIRKAGLSASVGMIYATMRSTTCGVSSRLLHRTPISLTTRFAPTF